MLSQTRATPHTTGRRYFDLNIQIAAYILNPNCIPASTQLKLFITMDAATQTASSTIPVAP